MNKTVLEWCGITFEIMDKTMFSNSVIEKDCEKILSNCYKSFSKRKLSIFDYWKYYIEYRGFGECGIHTHNAHFFTIGGYMFINGIKVGVYITPKHNYIFPLESE
ncbi:MAG: hypothetical protein KBT03_00545 [Bacteroidales bacterium]|nr:hypothetical protein [Candidatus Scybalousia scybalohippi]